MVEHAEGGLNPAEVETILVDLAAWLDSADGDAGWLAALRFGVAGALAQTQHTAQAEAGFRRIIAQTPQHLWAWVGLITLVLVRGDAPQAVSLGLAALNHIPDAPILRRKTAEALEQAEGPDAAIACLAPHSSPPTSVEDLSFAITLMRNAQRVAEVGPFCDALLALRPHDALAHLARIEMGLVQGDDVFAMQAAQTARAHHPDHAEIRLRAAQLHWRMGQLASAAALIEPIPDVPGLATAFSDLKAQLLEADPAAFARKPAAVESAPAKLIADLKALLRDGNKPRERRAFIGSLGRVVQLKWYHALDLVAHAQAAGQVELGDDIAAGVAKDAWSPEDRRAFAVEHCLLRYGPLATRDLLRANPIRSRDPEAAARLGRVLLRAGQAAVAARYLRRCLRKWPGDTAFVTLACEAHFAAGRPEHVPELVALAGVTLDVGQALHFRLAAALQNGCRDNLHALRDMAQLAPMKNRPLPQLIKLNLLCGDLAAAEALIATLSPDDGPLATALIQRPRATWLGSLLNEARILASMGCDDPEKTVQQPQDFFLTARALIAALPVAPTPTPTPQSPTVGGRPICLHLLWPHPATTTAEGKRIAAAWSEQPDCVATALPLSDGGDWLKAHHGARAAKAYRLLRDPEQMADLLLYGHLLHHGGVGLGAPLWPKKGMTQRLLAFGPTRFFLDETGAPSTTMILTMPKDAVIAQAFDLAISACLARENEHRWFKTGPGLLARAFAGAYLAHNIVEPVPVAPIAQLYRDAHPYDPPAT